jgi:hypothetical protein
MKKATDLLVSGGSAGGESFQLFCYIGISFDLFCYIGILFVR